MPDSLMPDLIAEVVRRQEEARIAALAAHPYCRTCGQPATTLVSTVGSLNLDEFLACDEHAPKT